MKTIADILLKNDSSINSIVNTIDEYGIVVISEYLNRNQLDLLKNEFSLVFKSKDPGVYKSHTHPTNKFGKVARTRLKKLGVDFATTKEIFLSRKMREISEEYFGVESFLLNDDVFFTHEKESDVAILPWHFDRQQALKFYINLIDVDETNGAFEFDLGSHREGHFRANYYIQRGTKIADIPNDIPNNELHNPVTINANAGDLIIFDPDGFHRGGVVSKGKERNVVRGHSHPIPNRGYKARLFDSHWWLQTQINLAKLLDSSSGRVISTKRLTKAVLTRK